MPALLIGDEAIEAEHHLKERVVGGRACRVEGIEDFLKRDLLPAECGSTGLLYLSKQAGKRKVLLPLHAQGQYVHENTDYPLQLLLASVGCGTADEEVLLAAVLAEHEAVGGEQQGKGRGLATACRFSDLLAERCTEGQGHAAPAIALVCRALFIGGQFQQLRGIAQVCDPVGKSRGKAPLFFQFQLPEGVVGVLDVERGQADVLAEQAGTVAMGQLVDEDAHGPAIGDDVVHAGKQLVARFFQLHEVKAADGAFGQVKGCFGSGVGDGLQALLWVLLCAQVGLGQGNRSLWVYDLQHFAFYLLKGGAQALVALCEQGDGPLQSGDIKSAREFQTAGDMVGRTGRFKLGEYPQPVLGRRQGKLIRFFQ